MDATQQPRPPRDDRAADEKVAPATGGALRCPYCHDALTGLAGDCVRCGTPHHLACFADHGGCSTHGCGSTRATTRRPGDSDLPPFTPLGCTACHDPVAAEAMVARCGDCLNIMHVGCYERLGGCGRGRACASRVELWPHIEAAAAQMARGGLGLMVTGVVWLVPVAALAAVVATRRDDVGPMVAVALVALLGVAMAGAGLVLRRRARRLVSLAPSPRGRKARP